MKLTRKKLLEYTPEDGCMLLFNAYYPTWSTYGGMLKYSVRRICSVFYGLASKAEDQFTDLYVRRFGEGYHPRGKKK